MKLRVNGDGKLTLEKAAAAFTASGRVAGTASGIRYAVQFLVLLRIDWAAQVGAEIEAFLRAGGDQQAWQHAFASRRFLEGLQRAVDELEAAAGKTDEQLQQHERVASACLQALAASGDDDDAGSKLARKLVAAARSFSRTA